ncbi:hypothetical protein [Brevibacillus sp. FIR094]|uniref:hypothetical protein n=1 Tax=Brevibacillus sp. FIR094 TaxID=3134809 RepID=UPI003D1ACBE4
MNRQINISFKVLIWIIISVVITCILLGFSIVAIIEMSKSNNSWLDTTISSLGNISGGIIGGIVAFLVAGYQVKKGTEHIYQQSVRTTYTMMRLIREEISYNNLVLDSLIPYSPTEEHHNIIDTHLQNTQWLNCSPNLGPEITDEEFLNLCNIYRQISVIKSSKNSTEISSLIEEAKTLSRKAIDSLDENIIVLKNKLIH